VFFIQRLSGCLSVLIYRYYRPVYCFYWCSSKLNLKFKFKSIFDRFYRFSVKPVKTGFRPNFWILVPRCIPRTVESRYPVASLHVCGGILASWFFSVCRGAVRCSSFRCWPVGCCYLGSFASVGGLLAVCWVFFFSVSVILGCWLVFGLSSSHPKSPVISCFVFVLFGHAWLSWCTF
jgi:hypothetical protein